MNHCPYQHRSVNISVLYNLTQAVCINTYSTISYDAYRPVYHINTHAHTTPVYVSERKGHDTYKTPTNIFVQLFKNYYTYIQLHGELCRRLFKGQNKKFEKLRNYTYYYRR